jgi:hypothetical protein
VQDRDRIGRELQGAEDQLAVGAELLTLGLELLDSPVQLFERADDQNRRLVTQTYFERLYVDDDGISGSVLKPPFDDIVEAASAYERARRPEELLVVRNKIGSLAHALLGVGSSKTSMVEVMPTGTKRSELRRSSVPDRRASRREFLL